MKVHAQKQLQQQTSPGIAKSNAKPIAASPAVHPMLRLQRTMGNQAVRRLIQMQTKGAQANACAETAMPPVVHEALHSSGQPMDAGTRGFMESRFGYDFNRVRVHTDALAARSADAVGAFAYTVGRDVVFGAGQYSPWTIAGQRLLAHELAHVVQQGGNNESLQGQSIRLSHPEEASERLADAAAETVLNGGAALNLGRSSPDTLHRAVKTHGGSFNTSKYVAINDASKANRRGVGKEIGADIHLNFKPNDLVEGDHIGLVQTVKTLRSRKAAGPVNIPDNARTSTLPDNSSTRGMIEAVKHLVRVVDAPRG